MTSFAPRFASPALSLALAGFVATGLTSAISAPQPDTSNLAWLSRAAGVPAAAGARVSKTFPVPNTVQQLPLFRQDFTRPAEQRARAGGEAPAAREVATPSPDHGYYAQLREKLRWIDVRMGTDRLRTPDPLSRVVLAQSAAQRAGLHEVGLNYRDVYGIINAETSWIPRMGASKDGTPNLGIAQFEPATAKALGLNNPHDPVEAIHVAAIHLKQAAVWSSKKLSGLKLPPAVQAAKLREGISIYYNLSTKGRNKWNGLNTAKLPIETRRHISNARLGAQEAATIEAKLRDFRLQERLQADNDRPAMVRTGG